MKDACEITFWDDWNITHRLGALDGPSERRMNEVVAAMSRLRAGLPGPLNILEIGCGTGWLSSRLLAFGQVTGVDLGEDAIRAARERVPGGQFLAGDIFDVPLPSAAFDVVVSLETLSHVHDQAAFFQRAAGLLKPGGRLLLTTQNRFVFERSDVMPLRPGFVRNWVDMKTLKRLLRPCFVLTRAATLEPGGHKGVLRILNSRKANRIPVMLLGEDAWKRLKERAGLGQTLFVEAIKRG